ncbi:hypothetical protein BH18ACT4_BH18ACT4_00150 [soil metagenome]
MICEVLDRNDVPGLAVLDEVAGGEPLARVRAEHEAVTGSHSVWGVPTFISGERAVFVRLMDRPGGDASLATRTIERLVELLDWPELNEFKHTSIPR